MGDQTPVERTTGWDIAEGDQVIADALPQPVGVT
jgi:hypothetical protein